MIGAIVVCSVPQHTFAEEIFASSSEMPYVTLLDEFTLYPTKETKPKEALGALSALQSVHLAPIRCDQLLNITNMDKVQIETWLGSVWINLKEGNYKYGKLTYEEQNLTLLEDETALYEAPSVVTPYTLAPQKVQAFASLPACDPYSPCRIDATWYLIHTSWLGDQWIRPEHYAEKYGARNNGAQVEGLIPIPQESEVYLYPFDKPIKSENKIQPQVIKPLGKYMRTSMAGASVWYQISTPKGPRWIYQTSDYGLGFERVDSVDQVIEMPVPFHYYKIPNGYLDDKYGEVPPQDVHVIGKWGDWYFTIVSGMKNGMWLNPSLEIAGGLTGNFEHDQKFGVTASQKRIELMLTSIVLDKPYEDTSRPETALTFSQQTVTALREWIAPNGQTWYYIQTWQGFKWVRL
ncbi:hypothetical protein [Paenibacillus roseipurpureus]|uniref:Uncharacterized protein n=1 Tax=Paenibacillus roseopurpureus TaxID=2918901 RepID=A0AA96RKH5_9BACL|nr:hypothetical protein [Paenibacillus sp. MBLB1832]WNR42082.1 hypothetical protein MJB10_13140 [Paenibacillus sp. MBLB1832]